MEYIKNIAWETKCTTAEPSDKNEKPFFEQESVFSPVLPSIDSEFNGIIDVRDMLINVNNRSREPIAFVDLTEDDNQDLFIANDFEASNGIPLTPPKTEEISEKVEVEVEPNRLESKEKEISSDDLLSPNRCSVIVENSAFIDKVPHYQKKEFWKPHRPWSSLPLCQPDKVLYPNIPARINEKDKIDKEMAAKKEDFVSKITQIDQEIIQVEKDIALLKVKEKTLIKKLTMKRTTETQDSASSDVLVDQKPVRQTLAQKIYSENREKARTAHAVLDHLGPKVDLPLYNQPSDVEVLEENRQKFLVFKERLIKHLRTKKNNEMVQCELMAKNYSEKFEKWKKKVEKRESSRKRTDRQEEYRKCFEKEFIEIKRKRDESDKFGRSRGRVKSDAEEQEAVKSLVTQEEETRRMRALAAVPPILLSKEKRKQAVSHYGEKVVDARAEHLDRLAQFSNKWSIDEKTVFKEKLLQHPKNFSMVSSCISNKSSQECVEYYYRTKKVEDYKTLMKKEIQGRGRHFRKGHFKKKQVNEASEQNACDDSVSSGDSSATSANDPENKQELRPRRAKKN